MGVAGSMGDGGVRPGGGWKADHRQEGRGSCSCHRQSPGSCLRAATTTLPPAADTRSLLLSPVVIVYVLVP